MINRNDLPDDAFAIIKDDHKLLRHHNEDVKDGNDHKTAVPYLVDFGLNMVDDLPLNDEEKQEVRDHLQSHRDSPDCTNKIQTTEIKTEKEEDQSGKASFLPSLSRSKIVEYAKENLLDSEKILNVKAKLVGVEKVGQTEFVDVVIEIAKDGPTVAIPFEVMKNQDGKVDAIRIYWEVIPGVLLGDIAKFLKDLAKDAVSFDM
jgi:hypothetical protein